LIGSWIQTGTHGKTHRSRGHIAVAVTPQMPSE
jgi:hypothetical protein